MPALRALLRLARILAATLGWFVLWVTAAVLLAAAPAARGCARGRAFARWGAGLLRIAGIELRVIGTPPRAPFVLVANHSSYLDVPVLAALGNGFFVAKAEIARWLLIGRLARGMATVFLEPGARRALVRAGEEIEARLSQGYGLFLFPEGGIPPGPELGEFRGSLLEPALRAGLPVHCAAIRYSTAPGAPPASRAVEWRRGEPLLRHFLAQLRISGTRATVVFGEAPFRMDDRKALARELRRRVGELLARAEREAGSGRCDSERGEEPAGACSPARDPSRRD